MRRMPPLGGRTKAPFHFLNTRRSAGARPDSEGGRAEPAAPAPARPTPSCSRNRQRSPGWSAWPGDPDRDRGFPVEMNAASRPVSELPSRRWAADAHDRRAARKPRLAATRPVRGRASPPSPASSAALQRARFYQRPPAVRVSLAEVAMGELEGDIGRSRIRHVARPRRP